LGFRVEGLGSRLRVKALWVIVQVSWFKVHGLRFEVQDLGFRG